MARRLVVDFRLARAALSIVDFSPGISVFGATPSCVVVFTSFFARSISSSCLLVGSQRPLKTVSRVRNPFPTFRTFLITLVFN